MRNFAVGPVLMDNKIRKIGAKQLPYFRTKEFSDLVLKNEALIKKFFNIIINRIKNKRKKFQLNKE